MKKRDYQHERELEIAQKDIYTIKIKKELSSKFKAKLQKENKQYTEFLREQIEKYVEE